MRQAYRVVRRTKRERKSELARPERFELPTSWFVVVVHNPARARWSPLGLVFQSLSESYSTPCPPSTRPKTSCGGHSLVTPQGIFRNHASRQTSTGHCAHPPVRRPGRQAPVRVLG